VDFQIIHEYTRTLTVLYVEDDAPMRESTAELFENYFKKIHTATDGMTGLGRYLEYYKNTGSYYDLVIADINMPGKNGIEMIRQMQLLRQKQPFIITSAHTEPHYLLEAINLEVASFVIKPINLENLLQALYRTAKVVVEQKMMEVHCERTEQDSVELSRVNRLLLKQIETLKAALPLAHSLDVENDALEHDAGLKKRARFQEHMQFFIAEDLKEMQRVLETIDEAIAEYREHRSTLETFSKQVGERLKHYGATLAYYEIFYHLGQNIMEFGRTLMYEPFPGTEEEANRFGVSMEHFCKRLLQWQAQLSDSEQKDFDQFGSSIGNDISTLAQFWDTNNGRSKEKPKVTQ
jgi:YesN/AraC family two-component response regulator